MYKYGSYGPYHTRSAAKVRKPPEPKSETEKAFEAEYQRIRQAANEMYKAWIRNFEFEQGFDKGTFAHKCPECDTTYRHARFLRYNKGGLALCGHCTILTRQGYTPNRSSESWLSRYAFDLRKFTPREDVPRCRCGWALIPGSDFCRECGG